jgi:hypothetical protein
MSNTRSAVCQRCQITLGNPWRSGGQLCWQCGIDYELFHPETRWVSEADEVPPPSMNRSRQSWWRRAFDNLRIGRPVSALRGLTLLLTLCSALLSSIVRADDCSDALIAEACACQSTVQSKQEQTVSSDKGSLSKRRRKVTRSLGNPPLDRLRLLEERGKTRIAAQ